MQFTVTPALTPSNGLNLINNFKVPLISVEEQAYRVSEQSFQESVPMYMLSYPLVNILWPNLWLLG